MDAVRRNVQVTRDMAKASGSTARGGNLDVAKMVTRDVGSSEAKTVVKDMERMVERRDMGVKDLA